jgi:hypothetical protein
MKKLTFLIFCSLLSFCIHAQNTPDKGGWKLVKYSFTDGTKTVDRVLAGTSDYMEDVTKYEGEKGDITIFINRYDKSSHKFLAGVNYNVKWTNPQSEIFPGENIKMTYVLKTITNKTWTPPSQSAVFNQGLYGIKLKNSAGEEVFKSDFNSKLISAKTIEKGYKLNEEKTLTVDMGGGFKAIYAYHWDPELQKTNVKEEDAKVIPSQGNKTGWYFLRWEYIVSPVDGTKTGHFANGDIYSEVNQASGKKNNFTNTITRIDKNGKTIASGEANTIWSDPPTYFSVSELPTIDIKRNVKSDWGINKFSISFDMKDTKPGGGSSGKINFTTPNGESYFQSFTGTLKPPKITKGAKQGDQKAIIFHINGYGFKYYYEWREY